MMDPNNVLIRCPNGHELQAAKADLAKPLACPVCNVTFTPDGGTVPTAMATGMEAPGTGGGAAVDYARDMLSSPIEYPGYTNWMLGLTVGTYMLTAVFSLLNLGGPDAGDSTTPSMGQMMLPCFSSIAGLAAIVLQLMWIYRIHKDAQRARGYASVSPKLALGLSFIPVFNFVWTAWTMKKLAGFSWREDAAEDSAESRALRATSLCLLAGIALALSNCVTFGLAGSAWLAVMGEVMQQNIPQAEMQNIMAKKIAESTPFAWQVIGPLISVACVLVYFRAVRGLEAALYPFLGAPNR